MEPESEESIPIPVVGLLGVLPVIVTLPVPVAEMLADELRKTPLDAPVPHEVPLTVSEPELVVTLDDFTKMPAA